MLNIAGNSTVLELIRIMLEAKDYDLCYLEGQETTDISSRHLFDLFISGIPAGQTMSSLLELSPALRNSENPSHVLFQKSIRHFISIFDSLHDGILIADKNEIVRYINKSFERISGARYATTVGQRLSIARPGAKLGGVIKNEKAMLGIRRKFGEIEYLTDMHPIFINDECVGGITVARDITEVQELQTKLSKYRIRYNDLLRKVNKAHTAQYLLEDIISVNSKMLKCKELVAKIAPSKIPVLLRGESGTGKELFAHAVHLQSKRAQEPFVTVNCAAIPTPLLESELFGYSDGAFSGAKQQGKRGLVTMADGGTLFLDEIGDMNIDLQAKILRVIQFGELQPLGSESSINVDVRIIAATNANLEKKMQEGKFREDLFYRLNASQINIPPLRERKEDIIVTAEYFLNKFFVDHPLAPLSLSEKTKEILINFPWSGNVRELENTINFIGSITDNQLISSNCLPPIFYEVRTNIISDVQTPENITITENTSINLKQLKYLGEKEAILKALDKHGRSVENKRKAANELGISLTTLYSKMAILDVK